MFAKYWEPGQVKTRLAASIGETAASRIYRAGLTTLLTRLAGVDARRVLAYAPPDKQFAFATITGKRWQLQDQGEGDLGERMCRYFDFAFVAGATRVVLIGSDSPTMPSERITQAFHALDRYDLVLGPSEDGGYYLVGAANATPDIFTDVAWSTGDVWSQTVERVERSGAKLKQLDSWYDVDDGNDLARLRDELSELVRADAQMWQALRTEVNEGRLPT